MPRHKALSNIDFSSKDQTQIKLLLLQKHTSCKGPSYNPNEFENDPSPSKDLNPAPSPDSFLVSAAGVTAFSLLATGSDGKTICSHSLKIFGPTRFSSLRATLSTSASNVRIPLSK